MKVLIKEVEGDGYVPNRTRRLSFKEFCQYVYEPSKRIRSLNLPENQQAELTKIIEKRLNKTH
jgi:hypothetical protein